MNNGLPLWKAQRQLTKSILHIAPATPELRGLEL